MSGCECKPDAKRKRDSARPQETAQPSKKGAHHEQKKQKREDGKVRHVFVCQETSNNNGDRNSEAA